MAGTLQGILDRAYDEPSEEEYNEANHREAEKAAKIAQVCCILLLSINTIVQPNAFFRNKPTP